MIRGAVQTQSTSNWNTGHPFPLLLAMRRAGAKGSLFRLCFGFSLLSVSERDERLPLGRRRRLSSSRACRRWFDERAPPPIPQASYKCGRARRSPNLKAQTYPLKSHQLDRQRAPPRSVEQRPLTSSAPSACYYYIIVVRQLAQQQDHPRGCLATTAPRSIDPAPPADRAYRPTPATAAGMALPVYDGDQDQPMTVRPFAWGPGSLGAAGGGYGEERDVCDACPTPLRRR